MTDKPKDHEEPDPKWTRTIAEEAAAAAPGIVGSFLGPVGGVAGAVGGIAVKGAFAAIRAAAATRAQRRAERFEAELSSWLEREDPNAIRLLVEGNERIAEVVFQNYRRAMDALDPSVIPTLAALTFSYRERSPDYFFKAVGLVLQELAGEDFRSLRQLLSAVTGASARWGGVESVEVTPWKSPVGRQELHFMQPEDRGRPLACVAPAESLRVLGLIKRHGVAAGFSDTGADLAMTNRLELEVETCNRLLALTGREEVDLFDAVYPAREPAGA